MTKSSNTSETAVVQDGTPTLSAEAAQCPATVHENVCIQAQVSITPIVTVGDIESFCVGDPVIGACQGTPSSTGACSFVVSQSICVQVPLTFSADAAATPAGISCGDPGAGVCPSVFACTYTIGYFKNHPAVTNDLITAAGGTIILGIGTEGASFAVTTDNADAVLSFMTPSPPAPSSPPFAQQYQNLYAQLLAANLNVQNGATCDYVTDAISNANAFIAASPSGIGQDGADVLQAPLALYNEGSAPGCPAHCP